MMETASKNETNEVTNETFSTGVPAKVANVKLSAPAPCNT
jgi:hypothetical protein